MKYALEPTEHSSILSNLSPAKKMLLTTMLVDTTPLEKKLLIWFLIGFVNWPITALDFKDSLSSTLLVNREYNLFSQICKSLMD